MSSLQESLNKFKQQQQKCHSTLSNIANRAAPSKSSHQSQKNLHAGQSSSTTSVKLPTAPVKFSNETERYQVINTIRKSSAGAQTKRVLDLLFETRQALTPDEINERCYVDVKANKAVFEILRNNIKVTYDGGRFSYKSKHALKNKDDLLRLIRKCPEGIAVIDVKDSYPSVMEDLQSLKASKQIWLLSNMDSQDDIAYPNDPKVVIRVDDDLKELFRSIELPRDMGDIERELQKNGMKPATNSAKRKAMAQMQGIIPSKPKPKKKREISKRTKLTNVHLPDLFKNLDIPD